MLAKESIETLSAKQPQPMADSQGRARRKESSVSDKPVPPFSYLLNCSRTSLQGFWLAHRNKSANSRKALRELMAECVEEEALALLAEWLNAYGEELMALAAGESPKKAEVIELEKPQPLTEPQQIDFSDWRSRRRHFRKRAG
jgi:hypothetical protein